MPESVLSEFDGGSSMGPSSLSEQKIEQAAQNVVSQIEEKTEIVAQPNVQTEPTRPVIDFHLKAGGGSHIKNPG